MRPSGPDVPAHMRRISGPVRVANFGQNVPLPFDDEGDRMSSNSQAEGTDDYDVLERIYASTPAVTSEEDLIRSVIANSTIAAVQQTNPELRLNEIQSVVIPVMNAQMQRVRRNERMQRMQRMQQLNSILQNCNPNQMRRLVRFIDSVEQANHETALIRRLQQLDQILQRPQRIRGAANVTRSYSREFRRFGCRTPQARRALHAFISDLRDQVAGRLRYINERRNARSLRQQQQKEGGKHTPNSKTKKRSTRQNKTVKRR
jgi:hypothetical protein